MSSLNSLLSLPISLTSLLRFISSSGHLSSLNSLLSRSILSTSLLSFISSLSHSSSFELVEFVVESHLFVKSSEFIVQSELVVCLS